jgi:AraC-like DNA-binding protein
MIGKTRQRSPALQNDSRTEEVFDSAVGPARGVLQRGPAAGSFRHARRSPAPELAHSIAHYWMVSWDLRGLPPHRAETLPHPNVHAVFEAAASVVAGVHSAKFTRLLEGRSHVFGVKFTPGGFRPFLKAPVSSLTDRSVPIRDIFGSEADALEAVLVSSDAASSDDEDAMVEAANTFFRPRVPAPDDTIALAGRIVNRILSEPGIRTVDDLAARTGLGKRSLQRLFHEYVGIPPKWVIRRYRLHELVERFHSGEEPDYAQLALELGYFDQAHLINDFRSIVGYSPAQYRSSGKRTG